jgi:CheY-like chemotaxis protein
MDGDCVCVFANCRLAQIMSRVLLIDDSPTYMLSLQAKLDGIKQVDFARTLTEAMGMIELGKYEWIVCDYVMPFEQLMPSEVFRMVQKLATTKVLIVSSSQDSLVPMDAVKGVDDVEKLLDSGPDSEVLVQRILSTINSCGKVNEG